MPITIADRGTPLLVLPKNSMSNDPVSTSTQPHVVPNVARPNATNFNSQDISSSTMPSAYQPFDIIDHAKKIKIQMFEVEYLQSKLGQFDRLVKFVKDKYLSSTINSSQGNLVSFEPRNLPNNLVTIPSYVPRKIDPFYISLLINGFKLSNYVIDSKAPDNVMPLKVANALDLTLTKTFGHCYSMENKQVPLIGQIKDAQFSFASFHNKKIKMTILVADVPASYGIWLGRKFCKDVGGELHMDVTQAKILVKGVMKKLLPK